MQKLLEIYPDGSYRSTTDTGAYGFIAVYGGNELTHAEKVMNTTNNVMEIMGVLTALEFINQHKLEDEFESIQIYCDSQYVINTITTWWAKWSKNGFRTTTGPVKNKELLAEMMAQYEKTTKVKVGWVKGHASNEYNNKIDAIVQALTKSP